MADARRVRDVRSKKWLAVPVIQGEKTAGERFPGAEQTFCIEAMMQDRKALQAGTSHFLGQNFAKAQRHQVPRASDGSQHCMDDELGRVDAHDRRPDHDALRRRRSRAAAEASRRRTSRSFRIFRRRRRVRRAVLEGTPQGRGGIAYAALRRSRDQRHRRRVSAKSAAATRCGSWIKRGVPPRLEIGPRDIEKDALFVPGRRDRAPKDKQTVPRMEFVANMASRRSQSIQDALFERAGAFREQHTHRIDTEGRVLRVLHGAARCARMRRTPIHAGFALTHFSGDVELEKRIIEELSVDRAAGASRSKRASPAPARSRAAPSAAASRVGEGVLSC